MNTSSSQPQPQHPESQPQPQHPESQPQPQQPEGPQPQHPESQPQPQQPEGPLPTPGRFHQPCWELILEPDTPREQHYLVWAPGEVTDQGRPTGKHRDSWHSSWQTNYGGRGGATRGDTLEGVLGIFPTAVADRFRVAVATTTEAESRRW